MKVPKTKEEMERADYSLGHVSAIFPDIKPNTLQVQIKRGVIEPAVPTAGQGHPTRFNYLNLIEIGLVNLLVARGINSHKFLRALLNSSEKHNPARHSLVEHFRAVDFSRYLLLPGGMRVCIREGEEINQDDPHPLYFHREVEELKRLSESMGIPDWLAVNVGLLKQYVDSKIREL